MKVSNEVKMALFNTMRELREVAQEPSYDGRNYFEQSEGAYKMLTALGINKEYIRWEQGIKKYRVEFEFMYMEPDITDGKWHQDYLDANGEGFTYEEAEHVAQEIRRSSICRVNWAEVVEMKEGQDG